MNTPIIPEPGIYHDVPADEYFSWQAVNQSSLKLAARSLQHYRFAPELTPSKEMRFGTFFHQGILEPAAIATRYAVMPDFEEGLCKPDGTPYSNPKASKAYKDAVETWRASIGDREQCTQQELAQMLGMAQALMRHDRARDWLCVPGDQEVSFVWDDQESGVRCKARVDRWVPGKPQLAVDLKTTRDASEFERYMATFAYHRQAAFYLDGIAACTCQPALHFAIIAIEKELPYGVRAALVADEAIEVGRREYQELLQQLAICRRTNIWPGYADPDAWTLPSWYDRGDSDYALTLNGDTL